MHTDNRAVSVCFGADDFVNHDFLLFISFDNKKGRQLRSYAFSKIAATTTLSSDGTSKRQLRREVSAYGFLAPTVLLRCSY